MTLFFLGIFYGIVSYIITELGKYSNFVIYTLIIINILFLILIYNKLYYGISIQGTFFNSNHKSSNITSNDIKKVHNNIAKLKRNLEKIEDKLDHKLDDKQEDFTNFYQCPKYKLLHNLESVLSANNINRVESPEVAADLYLPCGYNNAEDELASMKSVPANQKIYAIKGCDKLASKNELWGIFRRAYGFEGACKYMPRTFDTSKPDEIALFKDTYKEGQLYFLKKNIQRKEGILLTRDFKQIMEEVRIGEYRVIQEAVNDLYLIKKRKVNLRVYLLVICQGGVVSGFLYHEGKCIYSNKDVSSPNSANNDREEHLTSLNLDVGIYKTSPESLRDLKNHLGNYKFGLLWERIRAIFGALMKAVIAEKLVCNQKSLEGNMTFQLFGGDVIFDTKMNPFLLELNKGPSMKYMTKADEAMKIQLTADVMAKAGVLKNGENVDSKWISV